MLETIIISDNCTMIGDEAFINCVSLKNFDIPTLTTSIGEKAFYNCATLTSIDIPNGVTHIGMQAFGECTKMQSINVNSQNEAYSSVDKNLYNKGGTILIQYAIGRDENFCWIYEINRAKRRE